MLSLFMALMAPLSAPTDSPEVQRLDRGAEGIYQEYCVSCHGEGMQGGLGPNLLSGQWIHGGTDSDLARVIREGAANQAMPGFAAALSESETRAMVVYIREMGLRSVDPISARSKTMPVDPLDSIEHRFRIEILARELDVPWSLEFLPDGRLIFTERRGQIFLLDGPGEPLLEVLGLPPVQVRDEGGLMGMALHPDFGINGWIYLSLSDPNLLGGAMTKVVRGRILDGHWTDQETIFQGEPHTYTEGGQGFGGRIAFHDGYLFITVGERWVHGAAQDLGLPMGKIHRVFDDGAIPPDNPFVGREGALASIWAYGMRNPQGLAFEPGSGNLWETEHGPRGGDELNFIRPGANYGWPLATHGMNYDGTLVSPHTKWEGTEQPVRHWTPSIACSPIHFYTGDAFPQWRGNLFLGSLAKQQLFRFQVEEDRILSEELVLQDLGRIRDIKTGPDGLLYLCLELPWEPGYIVRLVPET